MFGTDEDKALDGAQVDIVDQQPEIKVDDFELEASDDSSLAEVEEVAEISEKELDVADPDGKPKQSLEENKIYAKLRRRAEEEAKAKLDAEKKELDEKWVQLRQFEAEQKVMSAITPQKIWDYASENGINEEFALKLLKLEAEKEVQAERTKILEKLETRKTEKKALAGKLYFPELEQKIDQFLDQNPDWNTAAAYNFLLGENAETLLKKGESGAEKRTIANMQDRMKRRVDDSDGGDDVVTTKVLSKEALEMSRVFGNDPRSVAKYVKNNLRR